MQNNVCPIAAVSLAGRSRLSIVAAVGKACLLPSGTRASQTGTCDNFRPNRPGRVDNAVPTSELKDTLGRAIRTLLKLMLFAVIGWPAFRTIASVIEDKCLVACPFQNADGNPEALCAPALERRTRRA